MGRRKEEACTGPADLLPPTAMAVTPAVGGGGRGTGGREP